MLDADWLRGVQLFYYDFPKTNEMVEGSLSTKEIAQTFPNITRVIDP